MSIITVAEKEFNLLRTGRDQAEQVIHIGKWLSQYGLPALQTLADDEGTIQVNSGFELLGAIVDNLSVDALIDLFTLIIGCSTKFANENFDIAILIDAATIMYESQPSFQKVISRFFSPTTSTNDTEE